MEPIIGQKTEQSKSMKPYKKDQMEVWKLVTVGVMQIVTILNQEKAQKYSREIAKVAHTSGEVLVII